MFIYELEQRLKELEQEQNHQEWLLQEELNKLERELINKGLARSQPQVACSGELVDPVKPQRLPKAHGEKMTTGRPVTKSNTQNYVIRLTVNPHVPLEWSGKNWARCGQGLRYSSLEIAQQSVQQLQKRWPLEKLRIHRAAALELEMTT